MAAGELPSASFPEPCHGEDVSHDREATAAAEPTPGRLESGGKAARSTTPRSHAMAAAVAGAHSEAAAGVYGFREEAAARHKTGSAQQQLRRQGSTAFIT